MGENQGSIFHQNRTKTLCIHTLILSIRKCAGRVIFWFPKCLWDSKIHFVSFDLVSSVIILWKIVFTEWLKERHVKRSKTNIDCVPEKCDWHRKTYEPFPSNAQIERLSQCHNVTKFHRAELNKTNVNRKPKTYRCDFKEPPTRIRFAYLHGLNATQTHFLGDFIC